VNNRVPAISGGTVVNADEASSWDGFHGALERGAFITSRPIRPTALARIWAEEYFSRLRPALRLDTITLARTCSATRKSPHGARAIGVTATAIRRTVSLHPRCASTNRRGAAEEFLVEQTP
jgi:hypothetical protein